MYATKDKINWNDKKQVLKEIKDSYGKCGENISRTLRKDRDVMFALIEADATKYGGGHASLDPKWYDFADASLWKDEHFILQVGQLAFKSKHGGMDSILRHVDKSLWQKKEFIQKFLHTFHFNYCEDVAKYMPNEFRKDSDFMLQLISDKENRWPETFRHLSDPSLLKDKEFVLSLIKKDLIFLTPLPASMRDDKDVVLTAVKRKGHNIQHASARLRDDKEVALAAITSKEKWREGGFFKCLSDRLRADPEVFLTALSIHKSVGEHIILPPETAKELITQWKNSELYKPERNPGNSIDAKSSKHGGGLPGKGNQHHQAFGV